MHIVEKWFRCNGHGNNSVWAPSWARWIWPSGNGLSVVDEIKRTSFRQAYIHDKPHENMGQKPRRLYDCPPRY